MLQSEDDASLDFENFDFTQIVSFQALPTNTTSNSTSNSTTNSTTNTTKSNTTTTNSTTNTTSSNSTTNSTTNTTKLNATTTNTSSTVTPSPTPAPYVPPPPPPVVFIASNMNVQRRTITTTTINGTTTASNNAGSVSGPVASVFNPTYDNKMVYKGGVRRSSDMTCTSRNTVIFVTALGGLNVTVPTAIATQTRLLQALPATLPNLTTSLTVSSVYWGGSIVMSLKTAVIGLVSLFAVTLAF